ncbi:hypothetical protein BaRGS_00004883 [Batillaria attramentaria]|uniref:Uncharacterized protein n=1 Tax=Batillaria attramentaria TaxID=370345 RepID=A0ABD0LX63_9CAEN
MYCLVSSTVRSHWFVTTPRNVPLSKFTAFSPSSGKHVDVPRTKTGESLSAVQCCRVSVVCVQPARQMAVEMVSSAQKACCTCDSIGAEPTRWEQTTKFLSSLFTACRRQRTKTSKDIVGRRHMANRERK